MRKRCILRRDEFNFAEESKLLTSFSKITVWTLQKKQVNKKKNLIRAKFILPPRNTDNAVDKMLILLSALTFMVGYCFGYTTPTN